MTFSSALWDFTDFVPKERRKKILSVASFDEVIDLVVAGTVVAKQFDQRTDTLCIGCSRIFFKLCISQFAYDAFFNSPVGYRAQYCISVENGIKQNRRIIEAITPLCLESIKKEEEKEYPKDKVLASIRGIDAKVWINDSDWPDIDEVHINYKPWVAKAQAANKGSLADQVARVNAAIGVLAPEGTYIEVKGAWITPDNSEWRDPGKAQRAEEIRDYGTT